MLTTCAVLTVREPGTVTGSQFSEPWTGSVRALEEVLTVPVVVKPAGAAGAAGPDCLVPFDLFLESRTWVTSSAVTPTIGLTQPTEAAGPRRTPRPRYLNG